MDLRENTSRIWDPVVRIGHWTLVAAFFTAYFTEDELLTQHVWAGYVVGAVVAFRVFWGCVGSDNARFTTFLRSPRVTILYLRSLLRGNAPRHIGHNPAGAAMIIAILLSLSGTVYSGLVLYAIEENAGPLAGIACNRRDALSEIAIVSVAHADDDVTETERGEDDREDFWEEFHEILANLVLLLVIVHVLGVLGSSYLHKENLVLAMFTGRKRTSAVAPADPE